VEVRPPIRPDIVANSTESGLYEFVNDFWAAIAQQVRALCAAGETLAAQRVGREGFNPNSQEGKTRILGLKVWVESQKRKFEAGGNAPLSDIPERGTDGGLNRRGYLRAVASQMRRTRVRWLATKSPCRTVTWQEVKP
jgi:hypothetical protein